MAKAHGETFDSIHVEHTDEGVVLAGKIEEDISVTIAQETISDAIHGSPNLTAIEKVALMDWIETLRTAVENACAKVATR